MRTTQQFELVPLPQNDFADWIYQERQSTGQLFYAGVIVAEKRLAGTKVSFRQIQYTCPHHHQTDLAAKCCAFREMKRRIERIKV